jgi:hypothetical protein
MAQQNRTTIKTFFETGDIPTQAQFGDSFDSQVFWVDDVETTLGTTDTKVPTSKAVNDTIVYTKDANGNVFYKGVTATLGAGSVRNIFQARATTNVLGVSCNHNNFEQDASGFTFGDNLRNVTIKSGSLGANYTAGGYSFLYAKDYPSEIFRNPENTANYHSYYDPTNDRIVLTNLTTLAVSYIGGGGGGSTWTVVSTNQTAVNDGQYTVVANSTFTNPSPVEGKGYWVLVRNGTATINSVSYSVAGTIVYTVFHSGSWANYVSLGVVNSGTQYRLAHYANNGTAVSENAAITAARALKSNANGLPTHFDTATEPSLTELAYVKGVTSAIQTQLNAKRKTVQSTGLGTPVNGTTVETFCKAMLIPANTFAVGDIPMLTVRIIKGTSTLGNITAKVYVNTVASYSSGSPILLATTPAQVSGTRSFATMRNISIESATESIVTSATTANSIEEAVTAAAETTMNINWTTDQYIVVTIILGSGSDTGNCRYIMIN